MKTESLIAIRPLYGISRKPDCWVVILKIRGERHFKSFAFKRNGGEESALEKAKAYRDSMLPLSFFAKNARRQTGALRQHSPSELLNITRQNPASRCRAWRVMVMFKGRKETRNFADAAYGGYEESLKAAQAYRDYLRSLLPRNQTAKPTANGSRSWSGS